MVLSLDFLLPPHLALAHPLVLCLEKLPDSTNLTDSLTCARANNTCDEPELVAWVLSLEGWQGLSGRDIVFSFGPINVFETQRKIMGKSPDLSEGHTSVGGGQPSGML